MRNETNKSSVTFLQRNGSSSSVVNNGSMLKLQKHMQSITNIKSFRQASESRFSERAAEVLSQMSEKGGAGGGGGRGLTLREREKLENTLLDNKIIMDKLKRRDAMIMEMRQIMHIDLVQSTLVKLAVGTHATMAAMEVQKKKQQDFVSNEEVLVLKLQDEIDALKRYLEAAQGETKAVEKRWKRELARNKDNAVLFEKNEVQFFDRIKELERERNGLHTAMSNKEHMIERIMRQFEEVSQQLGESNTKIEELNIALLEAKAEVDYKEKDRLSMQESLEVAVQAKLNAEAEAKQVITNTTAQKAENLDLRRRYELLVGELDELVRNNVFADKPIRLVEYHSDSSSEEEDEEEENSKSFTSGKRTKTEKVKDDSKRLEREERRRLRRERREKRRADAEAEAARHARKGRMLGNARDLVSFDEEEEAEESDEEVKNISFPHVTPVAPKVVEQKVQQAPPPQKVQQVQQQHEASAPTLPLGLGIYAQSKLDQDALAQERLLTSSLVRQVFSLETEMASIKAREVKLKAEKEEEREAARAKESDLQRRRISLQAEVNRLVSDNRELLNALQVAKSEAKSNRDILLANRGSNNMSSSARFSRYGSALNTIAGASPSQSTADFSASGHFKGQESTANLNSRFDASASSRQGAEIRFATVSEIRGLESVPKKEDVDAARKSMILDPEAWSNLTGKSKGDLHEDDDDDNVVQNAVKMATSNTRSTYKPTSASAKNTTTPKDTPLRGRTKSETSSNKPMSTVERFAAGNVHNLMKEIVVEEAFVEEDREEEETESKRGGRDEVAEREVGNALEEEEDYFADPEDQEQGREEEHGVDEEELTDVERRAKLRILYGESSSSGRDDYEFFSADKDCQTENLVTSDQNTSTLPNLCEYPQEESLLKIFRALRALTRWQIPTTDFAVPSQTQFGEDTEDQLRFSISKSTNPHSSTAKAGDDSSIRCRKILTYIYHANSVRNRLVREISERPTWDTGGSRIFVRCLDLVVQSIHFLVTGGVPASMEGAGTLGEQSSNNNNDEEENADGSRIQLEGAAAEIARCYAAFEQEEKWHSTSSARNANRELEMNDDISSSMQNHRAATADARVRFWNKKKRAHSPTNRLAETVFPNVETGTGSPRGVLGKYMNRSLQPRQLVNENVDALLSFNEEAAEIAQATAARRQRGRTEKANKDMNLELMWNKGVVDGEDEYAARAPYKSSPSASPGASRSPSPHKQDEENEGGRDAGQRPLMGSQEMQGDKDDGEVAVVLVAQEENETAQGGLQKPVEEGERKEELDIEEEEQSEDASVDDNDEEEEMEGKIHRPMYAKRREGLTGLSLLTGGEREASDSYVVQPPIKTHLSAGTHVDDGSLKIIPVQEGVEFDVVEIHNVDEDGGERRAASQRGVNEGWYGQWEEKSGELEVSIFPSSVLQKNAPQDTNKEEKLAPPPTVESDFLHRRLLQKKQHQQFLLQQEEQRKQWLLWQEQTGLRRADGVEEVEEEVDLYFGEGKDEGSHGKQTGLARQGKHEPMRQADVITVNLSPNGNGNKSRNAKDAALSLSPSLSEAITYAQLLYFESNKTRKIYSVPLVGVSKDDQAKEQRVKGKKGAASNEEDVSTSAITMVSQRPGTSIPLRPSVPQSSANRSFKQRPTTTGGSKELFETKERLAQTGSPPPPLGHDLWRSNFEQKTTAAAIQNQDEAKLRTASVDGLAINLSAKKPSTALSPSSPTPLPDEKKKIVVNLTSSARPDSFFISRPLLPSKEKPQRGGLKLD